jgi:peroxiredoxin Q/BCP
MSPDLSAGDRAPGFDLERATYLIDGDGVRWRVWHKVKVPGHVDAVLAAARAF